MVLDRETLQYMALWNLVYVSVCKVCRSFVLLLRLSRWINQAHPRTVIVFHWEKGFALFITLPIDSD